MYFLIVYLKAHILELIKGHYLLNPYAHIKIWAYLFYQKTNIFLLKL